MVITEVREGRFEYNLTCGHQRTLKDPRRFPMIGDLLMCPDCEVERPILRVLV